MPMTEDELAAIEARRKAANSCHNPEELWCSEVLPIVLDNDIPALLAEVRRLRAWLVEVRPGPYDGPYLDEIQELIDGALAGDPAPERTSP